MKKVLSVLLVAIVLSLTSIVGTSALSVLTSDLNGFRSYSLPPFHFKPVFQ